MAILAAERESVSAHDKINLISPPPAGSTCRPVYCILFLYFQFWHIFFFAAFCWAPRAPLAGPRAL